MLLVQRKKKQRQKWVREKRPELHIPIGQSKRLGGMQHIFKADAHSTKHTHTHKQSQALKLKVNNVGVAELLFISCYLKQAVVSLLKTEGSSTLVFH